jgi:hypothetical protein
MDTPILALGLVVVAAASLVNIYSAHIDDGFVGRLLYMGLVVTCLAGLTKLFTGASLDLICPALLLQFAALSVRDVCARVLRHARQRRRHDDYPKHQ